MPGTASTVCMTAGTRMANVARSRSNASTIAGGSTSRCRYTVAPQNIPNSAPADPAMWYSGITDSTLDRSVRPIVSASSPSCAATLAFVTSAPFGNPVVPDVYIWTTTSTAIVGRQGSVGGAAETQSPYVAMPGAGRSASVTPTVGRSPIAASWSTTSAPTTRTFAVESVTMNAISSG